MREIRRLIGIALIILKKDRVQKAIVLYVTMILGVVAGIVLSMLNTRMLGKELYGDFKFVLNFFTFAQIFLTVGIYYSGGRLIALQTDPDKKRELYGTFIVITAVISLVLIVFGIIFSVFEERIFSNNLQWAIIACLPLSFVFPMQLCLEQLLQGDQKIYLLSFHRLGPKIFNILILLALYAYFQYKLILNLEALLLSMAIPTILILIWLRPKFNNFKTNIKLLLKENLVFGRPVYMGVVAGVASAQIASFSLSYFVDNINVGFFALAITATTPLAMLPVAFGTTLFKDFINLSKIPNNIMLYTFLVGIATLVVFLLSISFIIDFLYPPEFAPVTNLCYYCAIGSTFHGFGDFLNRFLYAKGKGRVLRNSNYTLGIINIGGYIGLVFVWGIQGAAITKLLAGSAYMLNMVIVYLANVKVNNQ